LCDQTLYTTRLKPSFRVLLDVRSKDNKAPNEFSEPHNLQSTWSGLPIIWQNHFLSVRLLFPATFRQPAQTKYSSMDSLKEFKSERLTLYVPMLYLR